MKKKTLLVIGLVLLVAISLVTVGCGGTSSSSSSKLKVAGVFTGPVNDGSWNQVGYEGLVMCKDKLGAEIAYKENAAAADYESIFKKYAESGYNVIIGHSQEFQDAIISVAAKYPKVDFIIDSSDYSAKLGNGSNIAGAIGDGLQQGFLQGIVAAQGTKTNKVGAVGGLEIPAISSGLKGFQAGVNYANQTYKTSVKASTAITGSFTDTNKLKEQSTQMMNSGADIVMSIANAAGSGAYEAAKDKGKGFYAIGTAADKSGFTNYPDQIIASGNVDMATTIYNVVKTVSDKTFTGKDYVNGVKEGVVSLNFNDKLASQFTNAKKAYDDAYAKIKDGSLDVTKYVAN